LSAPAPRAGIRTEGVAKADRAVVRPTLSGWAAVEQLIEQTENQISLLLGGSPAAMARA
jgi:hypothetical protein